MKLATLKNGTRDGRLVVVKPDLSTYVDASDIAPTLQAALDDWSNVATMLQKRCDDLCSGNADAKPFDETECESPLPRAAQWLDGSAYINHVELVRKARGAEVPESFYDDPLMYQGVNGPNLAPRDPIPFTDMSWGYDMEGEIAVITDDVPLGVSEADALDHIKLVLLCNDVSLRGLIPAELAKGFGFVQSKPPCAFSPVAVTPDALGDLWADGLVHRPLNVDYNGEPFGRPHAHQDATFSLARLVAHAAKTRPLLAGTIVGSGTVSNKGEDGGPGKKVEDGGRGYACIAELRMIEKIETGEFVTPFMSEGDTVRIEMLDADGNSIFGAIDQQVKAV
ncbi:fumarylacetoacetate hydrolase family protein [uncultured Algimonas sp.]|uniref:fumarylacetoacetate hydrolase family protein n=1 Tax=uncultured Algimonas sp. TaxID=1547920 RepID=UPI00262CCD3F|nr:fumarylacetoacetate hydrolase family protein [uncultured Algimonas sp.]